MRGSRRPWAPAAVAVLAALAVGCASTDLPLRPRPEEQRKIDRLAKKEGDYRERGLASWYGPKFHGRPTASGEVFDMNRSSAAHRLLPFGTMVRVRNLDNRREIVVLINDRGPFVRGRIIDLSREAADQIGMLVAGIAEVELRVVRWGDGRRATSTRDAAPGQHATGDVWVQAGAFRDLARAERQLERVREVDREFGIRRAAGLYRVQRRGLGKSGAESLRQRLRELGFDAVVLRRRR